MFEDGTEPKAQIFWNLIVLISTNSLIIFAPASRKKSFEALYNFELGEIRETSLSTEHQKHAPPPGRGDPSTKQFAYTEARYVLKTGARPSRILIWKVQEKLSSLIHTQHPSSVQPTLGGRCPQAGLPCSCSESFLLLTAIAPAERLFWATQQKDTKRGSFQELIYG